ncbi:hypothetical protein L1987_78755 [Smallanthus sonchifolius]|uniref:Uncharacterized protein n=1 Tax=Smallanthus sonchifolius TaxID=185202 RepID=A0ACB8ZI12_9ASTR|nr:hypothetical protein L1987_78755 [Smallanthus sonchifolius]
MFDFDRRIVQPENGRRTGRRRMVPHLTDGGKKVACGGGCSNIDHGGGGLMDVWCLEGGGGGFAEMVGFEEEMVKVVDPSCVVNNVFRI